jgi:hypothetical protein
MQESSPRRQPGSHIRAPSAAASDPSVGDCAQTFERHLVDDILLVGWNLLLRVIQTIVFSTPKIVWVNFSGELSCLVESILGDRLRRDLLCQFIDRRDAMLLEFFVHLLLGKSHGFLLPSKARLGGPKVNPIARLKTVSELQSSRCDLGHTIGSFRPSFSARANRFLGSFDLTAPPPSPDHAVVEEFGGFLAQASSAAWTSILTKPTAAMNPSGRSSGRNCAFSRTRVPVH